MKAIRMKTNIALFITLFLASSSIFAAYPPNPILARDEKSHAENIAKKIPFVPYEQLDAATKKKVDDYNTHLAVAKQWEVRKSIIFDATEIDRIHPDHIHYDKAKILFWAIAHNNRDNEIPFITSLLKLGANPNGTHHLEGAFLEKANTLKTTQLFLQYGPHTMLQENGIACLNKHISNPRAENALIEWYTKQVNVNACSNGFTPLHSLTTHIIPNPWYEKLFQNRACYLIQAGALLSLKVEGRNRRTYGYTAPQLLKERIEKGEQLQFLRSAFIQLDKERREKQAKPLEEQIQSNTALLPGLVRIIREYTQGPSYEQLEAEPYPK